VFRRLCFALRRAQRGDCVLTSHDDFFTDCDVADKPNRSKSQRQLTRSRVFLYRLAVWLTTAVLEILWRTCRIDVVPADRLTSLVREHGAVVPVFWHQHLLMCARFLVSDRIPGYKPGFMISPSVDGEAPTMLAHSYGAHVVRGSGSYTGMRAVRGVHQAIVKDGISAAVTPDGPRGPRFKFKPGALFVARIAGRPVVPIAYAARPAFMLKTWDKFIIPVPFGRICMAIGEPYFPGKMGEEEMAAAQGEMEQRLHATFRQASAAIATPRAALRRRAQQSSHAAEESQSHGVNSH
jgi:lysophospholipid acyltransferase (LPLAT)-like uncharacterized protein